MILQKWKERLSSKRTKTNNNDLVLGFGFLTLDEVATYFIVQINFFIETYFDDAN